MMMMMMVLAQGGHNVGKQKNSRTFQALSRTFSRHVPAMFYDVMIRAFDVSGITKISIANGIYTACDGSEESLVFCKLQYIVQSIEPEVKRISSDWIWE